ncbi:MAG TPA: hypothetical protein PKE65_04875 [Rhizobiaceae bacterium]|nr:hypothetical protein [Rhizobiaceae bacterium]
MTSLNSTLTGLSGLRTDDAQAPFSGMFVGLFAVVGLGAALLQPSIAVTAATVSVLSVVLAGLAMLVVRDGARSGAMRAALRFSAPVLAAMLLWLAIAAAQALFGPGVLASGVAAPAFVVLVFAEALSATLVQFAIARLGGVDPAPAVALLIADKYTGFAGELR